MQVACHQLPRDLGRMQSLHPHSRGKERSHYSLDFLRPSRVISVEARTIAGPHPLVHSPQSCCVHQPYCPVQDEGVTVRRVRAAATRDEAWRTDLDDIGARVAAGKDASCPDPTDYMNAFVEVFNQTTCDAACGNVCIHGSTIARHMIHTRASRVAAGGAAVHPR